MEISSRRTRQPAFRLQATVLGTALTASLLSPLSANALAPADNTAQPMVTTALTRIADTRAGIGAPDALTDGETVTIRISGTVPTVAGSDLGAVAVVPQGADAVVLNMTAVDAAQSGFFTAWAAGQTQPATSNINFTLGETVANSATVPLGDDGAISIYARGQAHLLLDVAGYYRGGTYTATPAQRLYDSRDDGAVVAAKSLTHIQTGADEGDVVTLNITTDHAEAPGYFSVWSTPKGEGDSLQRSPATSTVNYEPGMIVSNTADVRVGHGGMVTLYSHAAASVIVDETHRVRAAEANAVAVIYDRPHRAYDSRTDGPQKQANLLDSRYWISRRGAVLGHEEIRNGAEMDAQAVILNVTVTNAPSDGYVSLSQFFVESSAPATSSLNFLRGETRANRVIVPLDLYGSISGFASNQADVVVDLLGYVPKSSVAADVVDVDLSSAMPIRHLEPANPHYTFNAAEVDAIRFDAEDLDANGIVDWVIDADTAKLSHPYATTVAEYRIVDGPTEGERTSKVVEYTGSPHAWRAEGGAGWRSTSGAVVHYKPSMMQVSLRNTLTGETAVGEFPFRGHWEGSKPLAASGSRDKAPWLTNHALRIEAPAEPVEVGSHEPTIKIRLPQPFVEAIAGDVKVFCDDLPANRAGTPSDPGLIARDGDGDAELSVTLPPVSTFHHEDVGSLFWKYPVVHLRVQGTDVEGNEVSTLLSLVRR